MTCNRGGRQGCAAAAPDPPTAPGGLMCLPYIPTSMCLSRDNATLYVGGDDRNIRVYALLPCAAK